MLPRINRLRRRSDVQRVRQQGRRWRHPLAILLVLPTEQMMTQMDEVSDPDCRSLSRFAFSASRRVGYAVSRNRAKRLLRAAVYSNLARIEPGWDCLIIAREETPQASFGEVERAVLQLLSRSRLIAQYPQPAWSQRVGTHDKSNNVPS
jgi:ribonuclease P protein component